MNKVVLKVTPSQYLDDCAAEEWREWIARHCKSDVTESLCLEAETILGVDQTDHLSTRKWSAGEWHFGFDPVEQVPLDEVQQEERAEGWFDWASQKNRTMTVLAYSFADPREAMLFKLTWYEGD